METQRTIRIEHQPHTFIDLAVETVEPVTASETSADWQINRARKGWVRVTGKIVKGVQISRLFQHSTTRDLSGQAYTDEMPRENFEAGKYVTALCG